MTDAALEVRGLGCTLGNRRLFSELDFSLPSGRWLMLTGSNGAGKSTLLKIVSGLLMPTGGEVRWHGVPRKPHDPAWHASIVYQGHATGWKEQLTALENLTMQAWLDHGNARREDREDVATRAIERVGLSRQRNLPFARLSAGQRRRLGLARLAFSNRPLWLLDEPTTALDTDGQHLFAGLLDEHLAAGGCAIVATHLEFPTTAPALPLRLTAPARTLAPAASA